jgi:hypothetical protein
MFTTLPVFIHMTFARLISAFAVMVSVDTIIFLFSSITPNKSPFTSTRISIIIKTRTNVCSFGTNLEAI